MNMVGIAVAPATLSLVQNAAVNLENGLKNIFLVGAITMTKSLILSITIPKINIDANNVEKSNLITIFSKKPQTGTISIGILYIK